MKFILRPNILVGTNILFMICHLFMFGSYEHSRATGMEVIWSALLVASIFTFLPAPLNLSTNARKQVVLGLGLCYLSMPVWYGFSDRARLFDGYGSVAYPDGGIVLWSVVAAWFFAQGLWKMERQNTKGGGERELQKAEG